MFAYEIKVKVISKQNENGAQLAKMLAEKSPYIWKQKYH